MRFDENDQRFERPRPRGNVELFNPKGKKGAHNQAADSSQPQSQEYGADPGPSRQQVFPNSRAHSETEKKRGDAVKNAILVEKFEQVSLGGS
jgi:hypothetical protein